MSRPVPASTLALLLALGAVSASSPVAAASPTGLKSVTLDYDPAVFTLIEDGPTPLGARAVLDPVNGLALVSVTEFHDVGAMPPRALLSDLMEDQRPAKPPFPVDKGPDGWECIFHDFNSGDASASVMACARNSGGDLVMLRVMTTPGLTSPDLYEAIRTMIATIRFRDAP